MVSTNFREFLPGNFRNFRLNDPHFGNATVFEFPGNFPSNFIPFAPISKFPKFCLNGKRLEANGTEMVREGVFFSGSSEKSRYIGHWRFPEMQTGFAFA